MQNILLFIGLFIATALSAQRTHLIELKPEPIDVPTRNFYISSVVDARLNQQQLGTVQKGMANRKTPADFPTDLTIYLGKAIAQMLPAQPTQTAFLLKINELRISEQTTFSSEQATAFLDVDFLNPANRLSYGNFTSEVTKKAMDVTGSHDQRILDALTNVFNEFATSDWENTTPQAIATTRSTWDYEQIPPRGLFSSFVDLANNQPMEPIDFDIRFNKQAKFKHYSPRNKSGKKIKDVFVISNGEDLYLNVNTYNVGDYFVKSQTLGRYAYFEDAYSDQGAAILFGAIGAGVSYKTHSIILDLETGIVKELTEEELDKILTPYPDLYQKFKNSKNKAKDKLVSIEAVN